MMLEQHQRKPGFLERFFICRNVGKYYINFNVTAKYNQRINHIVLSNALKSHMFKNPQFCTNFYRRGRPSQAVDRRRDCRNFRLQVVDQILYEDVVEVRRLQGEFGVGEVELLNQVAIPVDSIKPLWRIVIYENEKHQYVTFLCDHILFDGNSGARFHQDLIKEVGRFSHELGLNLQNVLFDYDEDKEKLPGLLGSSDQIVDLYKCGFGFMTKEIFKEFWVPNKVLNWYRYWTKDGHPHPNKTSQFKVIPTDKFTPCKFKIIHLDAEETRNLLKLGKGQQLTLTPFLATLVMLSLQETVFPLISAKSYAFDLVLDIDGRRYFPELGSKIDYGLYMTGLLTRVGKVDRSRNGVVKMAKQLNSLLQIDLKSKRSFSYIGLLKFVNGWKHLESKIGKHSRETLEVSNLGAKDIEFQDWAIEDLLFTQTCGELTHFCLSTVSTRSGGMNICLSYVDEFGEFSGEKDVMDSFEAFFRHTLENL